VADDAGQSGDSQPVDLIKLDAAYQPFAAFRDWAANSALAVDAWTTYTNRLAATKKEADPAVFDRAVGIAIRSAAIETGAIEGLYQVGRGFTFSVAT
jgi:hypothetical protein